jgi:hypothetical protein
MGKVKHYFAEGNTADGFFSLYEETFQGLERLYILKGGPGTGKSSFMRGIAHSLLEQGYNAEYYHCSLDSESINGVIIPALQIGFVDGTFPHNMDPQYPGIVEQLINLGDYWDSSVLMANKDKIKDLFQSKSLHLAAAYRYYEQAKEIHDEWEQIYIQSMDFYKANKVTKDLIGSIFSKTERKGLQGSVHRKLFGAATPFGAVNYYDNLTEALDKRYIIKGRPGSGKSTMMKKIGKRGEQLGLDVEYYPCGLDPESIDMVLIPDLNTAVLDGTAPHVVDPVSERDIVVDMFQECMNPKVEEDKAEELKEVSSRYAHKMKRGTEELQKAKHIHDRIEAFYIKAMNFKQVDQKREQVLKEILDAAGKQKRHDSLLFKA